MKIACLGWGSLIWRPENLLIQRHWFQDGPMLPIEYTRQSKDGRLTLVLTPGMTAVRSLWAVMATEELEKAKTSLQIREGIGDPNKNKYIGSIRRDTQVPNESEIVQIIRSWMNTLQMDAVIWTNLPPRFNGNDDQIPTLHEATKYLIGLDINTQSTAEQYIRKTPQQIDTSYRRDFEKQFGWTYLP